MKNPSGKNQGNKGRQMNSLKAKAPERNDDPQRHQPPTPQDIARVQPVSQSNNHDRPGKTTHAKSGKKK